MLRAGGATALGWSELEAMSYEEIAAICGIPVGTVMSRLACARQSLERHLTGAVKQGALP